MTTTNKPAPRLPEAGEFVPSVGLCEGMVEVPPPPQPPPTKAWSFLYIDYTVVIRQDNVTLRQVGTLTDFYGPNTGLEDAMELARSTCAVEEITPDSRREVVVVKATTRRLRVPTRQTGTSWEDGCCYGGYTFRNFRQCDEQHFPRDKELSLEVVWSSRKPNDNAPIPIAHITGTVTA